jgi:8-oxo-dGTP diphosphatase
VRPGHRPTATVWIATTAWRVIGRRYRAAVPVYLVRHAHAGSRAAWTGDDSLRPLSPKGNRQAKALVERLDKERIKSIVSSPARRCTETVVPLARRLDRSIDERKEFFEGADADDATALLVKLASRDPVICSHGDLIPKVIRRLVGSGMKTKDPNISQKGSLWVIDFDGDQPVKGKYYPPS